MRQLIQSYRTGEMRVEEVPPPMARPGGVVVRTVRSLVSAGTERMIVDLARRSLLGKARARPDLVQKTIRSARREGLSSALRKARARLDTPIPLGYSSAGIVVEVGEQASALRVGDRVACAGAGYAVHADYAYVPRNLVAKLPADVSMAQGAFATVGAIALQGLRQAGPTLGERVAVLGLGLLGQLAVQLLRANGCRVLGFDPDPWRAELARAGGAHAVASQELEQAAEEFSDGEGIDAVIVAAASPDAVPLRQAGEISRMRGRVVVVGMVRMEIPRNLYYRKELDLRMSLSTGAGRHDPAFEERGFDYPLAHVRWTEQRNLRAFLELASDARLDLERLITHRFGIDEALGAYELLSTRREPHLGVLLEYGAEDEAPVVAAPTVRLARAAGARPRGGVRVGVIGAGSFGASVTLPVLAGLGGVEPVVIASAGGASARRAGDRYRFQLATSRVEEVLDRPEIEAVFVLTRHDSHADLVIRALAAGKHVFTEKPLALSRDELEAIAKARETSGTDVMVGFNRRFAPLTRRIVQHFAGRDRPLMMHYRVNAGALPPDHWVRDPVAGGGRILGEACHFVDLLQHLAGAPPVRVFADSIAGDGSASAEDNVSITLSFGDGSLGTIAYTSLGDRRLAKERLEVFGGGRVAVLEDFRRLTLTGGAVRRRTHRAWRDAKGFEAEIRLYLEAVRSGGPLPIAFEASAATTRATLAVTDSLRSGRPEPA